MRKKVSFEDHQSKGLNMISYIKGVYADDEENLIIVDCHDIGYEVHIADSKKPLLGHVGDEIMIYTYMDIKENDVGIYGFTSKEERELFKLLITVSTIGASTAIGILGFCDVPTLCLYISTSDVKALSKAPKLGTKKAERIVTELKNKVCDIHYVPVDIKTSSSEVDDAVEALMSLGYQRSDIMLAISATDDLEGLDSGKIMKKLLKKLI